MPSTTLTRSEICDTLSSEGIPSNQSSKVLETVLSHITQALVAQGQVKISSFGTFHVREKGERIGRNPKTGQEVPIAPRKSLSFRASPVFRQVVDK